MTRKAIIIIYTIIIGLAIGMIVLNNHKTETGIIKFSKVGLATATTNVLAPKIATGDLVIINTEIKQLSKGNIITYITKRNGKTLVETNQIVAITQDVNNKNIYSLKNKDGTIENIDDSCILGCYQVNIPILGTVINYMTTQDGFLTITLVPSVTVFLLILFNFVINLLKPQKY